MDAGQSAELPHAAVNQERADQACARCHRQKVKCVPSGLSDRCERCYKYRVDCTYQTPKKRRRRGTCELPASKKIAIMEEKIDKVFALLSADSSSHVIQPVANHLQSMRAEGMTNDGIPISPFGSISNSVSPTSLSPKRRGGIVFPEKPFGERLIDALLPDGPTVGMETFMAITDFDAQRLLRSAQALEFALPFLQLENMMPSDLLSNDCPFLTAALIVVTAHEHQLDQVTLAREFRSIMSQLVIVGGKRNIRVLQGLLIFLLRHHQYMDAEGPSVIMIFHLCVGLLVDLECDILVQGRASDEPGIQFHNRIDKTNEIHALLVANYISCGLSFKCLNNKQRVPAAESLPQFLDNEVARDTFVIQSEILILNQLCCIVDDIHETFPSQGLDQDRYPFDESFTQIQVKRLERSATRWHKTKVDNRVRNCSIDLTASFVHVLLYAKALQPKAFHRSQPYLSTSDSGLRLSLHSHCLHAVKVLLDDLIQLPDKDFAHLNFIDFILVVSTLTVLSRLSHPSLGCGFDSLHIDKTFDHYSEQTIHRLTNSAAYRKAPGATWSFTDWFTSKCESLRQSIAEHVPASLPTPASDPPGQSNSQLQSSREQFHWVEAGVTYPGLPTAMTNTVETEELDFGLGDFGLGEFPWDSLLS